MTEPLPANGSAAAAVWAEARARGAASAAAYATALSAALSLDRARAALGRAEDARSSVRRATAGVDVRTADDRDGNDDRDDRDDRDGTDGPADVDELDAAIASALAVVADVALALAEVDRAARLIGEVQRRSSAPRVVTLTAARRPAGLDPHDRALLDRVQQAMPGLDPAINPALGQLAGTPRAALARLIDDDPLFGTGVVASARADVTLDEVTALTDALEAALRSTFGDPPPGAVRTAVARVRRVAGRVARRLRRRG